MRKFYIFLIGTFFSLAIVGLFILQYFYFDKVVTLNKGQITRLANEALSEAIEDIEIHDFVQTVSNDFHQNISFHERIKKRRISDVFPARMKVCRNPNRDTIGSDPSELRSELLWVYFNKGEQLDRYILRYIYEGYNGVQEEELPNLVPSKRFYKLIKKKLINKGLSQDFKISVYTHDKNLVYEYVPPGIILNKDNLLTGIHQLLFYRENLRRRDCPYVILHLDYKNNLREMIYIALPGMIYIIILLVLAILIMILWLRQIHFQDIKSAFINNMTHELKTPISSISLALQSLRTNPNMNEERKDNLMKIMEQETERLRLHVEKVLQTSLLKEKKQKISMKVIDLYEEILPIIEIYEMHTEKLKGSLNLEFDADDTWVNVDPIHLKNIFFNIFDNSIKYRSSERPIHINIKVFNEKDSIVIQISDNGIGVPKDQIHKIFDRYYRVATGYTHDVKGYGLGLSYVEEFIRIFKGTITANLVPTGGLMVCISLPTAQEDFEDEIQEGEEAH